MQSCCPCARRGGPPRPRDDHVGWHGPAHRLAHRPGAGCPVVGLRTARQHEGCAEFLHVPLERITGLRVQRGEEARGRVNHGHRCAEPGVVRREAVIANQGLPQSPRGGCLLPQRRDPFRRGGGSGWLLPRQGTMKRAACRPTAPPNRRAPIARGPAVPTDVARAQATP